MIAITERRNLVAPRSTVLSLTNSNAIVTIVAGQTMAGMQSERTARVGHDNSAPSPENSWRKAGARRPRTYPVQPTYQQASTVTIHDNRCSIVGVIALSFADRRSKLTGFEPHREMVAYLRRSDEFGCTRQFYGLILTGRRALHQPPARDKRAGYWAYRRSSNCSTASLKKIVDSAGASSKMCSIASRTLTSFKYSSLIPQQSATSSNRTVQFRPDRDDTFESRPIRQVHDTSGSAHGLRRIEVLAGSAQPNSRSAARCVSRFLHRSQFRESRSSGQRLYANRAALPIRRRRITPLQFVTVPFVNEFNAVIVPQRWWIGYGDGVVVR
jgi:hypothetical protein